MSADPQPEPLQDPDSEAKPRLPGWAMGIYVAAVIMGVGTLTLRLLRPWSLAIIPALSLLYWLVWRRFEPPRRLVEWGERSERWMSRPKVWRITGTVLVVMGLCLAALEALAMIEGTTRGAWGYVAGQLFGMAIAAGFFFIGRSMRTRRRAPRWMNLSPRDQSST